MGMENQVKFYLFFILWKDVGATLNMDSNGAGDI